MNINKFSILTLLSATPLFVASCSNSEHKEWKVLKKEYELQLFNANTLKNQLNNSKYKYIKQNLENKLLQVENQLKNWNTKASYKLAITKLQDSINVANTQKSNIDNENNQEKLKENKKNNTKPKKRKQRKKHLNISKEDRELLESLEDQMETLNQIYLDLLKNNPTDPDLTSIKDEIEKLFTDFNNKINDWRIWSSVHELEWLLDSFIKTGGGSFIHKYNYLNLKNHLQKEFPENNKSIEKIENEIKSKIENGATKSTVYSEAAGLLSGKALNSWNDYLIKHDEIRIEILPPIPYQNIIKEGSELDAYKVWYNKLYKSFESSPQLMNPIYLKNIDDSLKESSTINDYKKAILKIQKSISRYIMSQFK